MIEVLPTWNICKHGVRDLPDPVLFKDELRIGLDHETTSFDDNIEAFQPYLGHRVAGTGIYLPNGHGWYLPVRHRSINDTKYNIPLEKYQRWMNELGQQRDDRVWDGHNLKFDLKFSAVDDVWLKGQYECTMVLSRIVDTLRFNASLKVLCREFLPESQWKDSDDVQKELDTYKSKDYGRVSIDTMGIYCLQDLNSTLNLKDVLLTLLLEVSKPIWEIEKKTLRTLFKSEHRGLWVPRDRLKRWIIKTLHEVIPIGDRINELAGQEVDCLSNKSLTAAFTKLAIQPRAWGKDGPSWDGETLRSYGLEITDLVARFKELSSAVSSFGEGWLNRLADDDTLHPNFKQAGTKTGRLASEDPNFQNLTPEAKKQVVPRPGYCFISIDYSQIEFRLFAHYTNAPGIVAKYQEDPWTDFHQATADLLGISRSGAKTTNFGMIYGMGKQKLIDGLTLLINEALRIKDGWRPLGYEKMGPKDQEKFLVKNDLFLHALKKFNYQQDATSNTAHIIAANAYNFYHREIPEIRKFQRTVEDVAQKRGFVKNLFGRVYRVPAQFAHKLRNYVIQGAAADLLKDRMAVMPDILEPFDAHLLCNVHDEVLIEVPIEHLHACVAAIVPSLETPSIELRVPIKVEVAVCYESWGDKQKYVRPEPS